MTKERFFLLIIILLGLFLRLQQVNWDSNLHLHPDERFLTMVGNAVALPKNIADYLNPETSGLNPANSNFPFFVYGLFPLTLNKIIAVVLKNDTYNLFTLQGRVLAALLDVMVIFCIYKVVEVWERDKKSFVSRNTKVWAAFCYAIMVLPVQLSHFFTVDAFLSAFVFLSFTASVFFSRSGKMRFLIASAIFFGLAVGSKINAILCLPFILYELYLFKSIKKVSFRQMLPFGILFCVITYLTIRLASPYYFEAGNLLNPTVNANFIDNIKSLKSFDGKDSWFPPSIQWISKTPVLFTLVNLGVFGVGIVQFIFILTGMVCVALKQRRHELLVIGTGVFFIIAYQSLQFVQTMRYLIFIYPFLALFGGVGIVWFLKKIPAAVWVLIPLLLVWPMAFVSIYFYPHSRLQASEWIYKNVPHQSIIFGEYWDDALPVSYENNVSQNYNIVLLKVFDQDTAEKWKELNQELARGDYYVLSSNRAWGSIIPLPKKYPQMSTFYKDLLADKTSYKKVAEFTSYPSFRYLGIPIDFPDEWAEEAFSVYDHPKVLIFKNSKKI